MSRAPEQLAERQLRRLAAVSGGSVQLVSGPFPFWQKGWFGFDVSLDLAGLETAPGGIGLRPRERFFITVGPDYPFIAPVVEVPHLRWAGTPHVQWGRQICMYLAPALEWAPEDGMRGLIDRLMDWLAQAAAANLDPAGQPPHPPIAYPDTAAGFAVIHADVGDVAPAGELSGSQPITLLGWGGGADGRVDVDAWLTPTEFAARDEAGTLPDIVGRARATVCIVLDAPIAFEYPVDVAGLAAGLQQAGLSREALHDLVRQAAVATAARLPAPGRLDKGPKPPLPPLTVFIGSPSRSVDGLARQIHLVGFSLDLHTPDLDTMLETLQASTRKTVTPDPRTVKLSWLTVYEARSEVTRRRDHDSPMALLRGQRILVLGAGALGAPVAEACVRAGADVTVVDNGRVTPGILVRQPYYDTDIGQFKASVLARRLNGIRREPGAVAAIAEDAIGAYFKTPGVPDFDLVVDATANAGVRAAIDRARASNRDQWPALITMLVGHVATLGLLTVSAAGASGAGHDVLRRAGIAAREPGSGMHDIAAEFFPHPPRTDLFQPEPGCSEPTFTGSAADLAALGNAMLLAAVDVAFARADHFDPMTAVAVRSPLAAHGGEGRHPAVASLGWTNDRVVGEESGEYEVRLSHGALSDIRAEVRRRARLHAELVETGGMLIGTVDDGVGCIFVDHACPPTPDSMLGRHHFEHGTDGAQASIDHFRAATADASGFVGMWHTHPEGAARPSTTDEQGMGSLVIPIDGVSRALMLIVAGDSTRWASWRDADDEPDIYLHQITSTTTAATGDQPPRPPGEYFRAGSAGSGASDAAAPGRLRRWMSKLASGLRRRQP